MKTLLALLLSGCCVTTAAQDHCQQEPNADSGQPTVVDAGPTCDAYEQCMSWWGTWGSEHCPVSLCDPPIPAPLADDAGPVPCPNNYICGPRSHQ